MQDQQSQQEMELALITEMIHTARRQFNEKGTIFLMWGWLVAIAAVAQYTLLQLDSIYNALPWLLMPIGGIAQIFIMRKERREEPVKTHVGKVLGKLWTIVALSIGLTLIMAQFLQTATYPVLLMLYAVGTFTTGYALDMRPLIYGALGCFIIAAVSFFADFEMQLLLLATAMILAYIIPGYTLNARYKRING